MSIDERRWLAVSGCRSNSAESDMEPFFYGVTSTGVVCRPECPSRRPRRENTVFFDTVADALRAGYRLCLRCRPAHESPGKQVAERISRASRSIDESAGTVTLAELAHVAGLSPFHLQRSFRAALGVTPAQYARRARSERLQKALAAKDPQTATEAIYAAGFQSPSRAYAPGNALGMTPGKLRQGGANETIRYSIADSPLGRMLVAATAEGVCSIAFADSDAELLEELRERFAAADLQSDAAALGKQIATVLESLKETAVALELPLHVRATAFQHRVWQALQAIPRGETRTYAQVAAAVGQPTAARAVARACATNPVAVVVPCHRVVGADGKLTGYRWGVQRKRALLAMERGGTAANADVAES